MYRGVFRTLSNISDEAFWLKDVDYIRKTFHHRCFIGFWIRFWYIEKLIWPIHFLHRDIENFALVHEAYDCPRLLTNGRTIRKCKHFIISSFNHYLMKLLSHNMMAVFRCHHLVITSLSIIYKTKFWVKYSWHQQNIFGFSQINPVTLKCYITNFKMNG